MLKVISSEDKELSDQIIIASNNQTLVEQAALRATDKLQRDIEDTLESFGWFYERRVNYFKNIGKPEDRVISPMYLAGAYVSVCMKNPAAASTLKSRFMRTDARYRRVFDEEFPLKLWVKLVEIQKASEGRLIQARREGVERGERFLKNWRGMLSLLTVGTIFQTLDFPPKSLERINVDDNYLLNQESVWNFLSPHVSLSKKFGKLSTSDVLKEYGEFFGVTGIDAIGKQSPNSVPSAAFSRKKIAMVTDDLLEKVDMLLPAQPWERGVHRDIATKLGCSSNAVSAAIQKLIMSGRRQNQIAGRIVE